jgi:lipopolysaccharide transport system permease protein
VSTGDIRSQPSAGVAAPTARPPAGPGLTVLRPSRGWVPLRLRELWEYHELLYFLVWRDVKVRYKQTVLGAAWAIIQPFATMVVFSVVFGHLARLPSDGVPYPIFAYTALVPWTYFANAATLASNSLVQHERLITKVYFPRLIIPLAAVLSGLVDLALALVVLVGMMLFYGITPTPAVWALPLFVLLAVAAALAVGLWLSALNVLYRDVRHVVPFLIQLWLFATPVAYSSAMVPERWRAVYGLNPMTGVVDGFRWALLGTGGPPALSVAVSAIATLALLLAGTVRFRRMEQTFADVI